MGSASSGPSGTSRCQRSQYLTDGARGLRQCPIVRNVSRARALHHNRARARAALCMGDTHLAACVSFTTHDGGVPLAMHEVYPLQSRGRNGPSASSATARGRGLASSSSRYAKRTRWGGYRRSPTAGRAAAARGLGHPHRKRHRYQRDSQPQTRYQSLPLHHMHVEFDPESICSRLPQRHAICGH